MHYQQLTVTRTGVDDAIAVVTFARPDKMNALTKVMEAELYDAFETLGRDDRVRVIVLTGKGFGVTNLVVLDREGSPIIDEQLTVVRQSATTVRIYRRAQVQTMSCTPYCESSFKSDAEKISENEMNTGN